MNVLGISGLFATARDDYPSDVGPPFFHDSAASLVIDGEAVFAIEEERLNREKHSNKFPVMSIRASLEHAGLSVDDLDAIAFFFDEHFVDSELYRLSIDRTHGRFTPSRDLIVRRIREEFDEAVSPNKIHYVPHHLAHAATAYVDGGFETNPLVAVFDGNGEAEGVSFYRSSEGGLHHLRSYPKEHSLGHYYAAITKFLGYREFDEYKVMGLSSYGDPSRFVDLFKTLYSVDDMGHYELRLQDLATRLLGAGLLPRDPREPIGREHMDVAAAAQAVLEEICQRLIRYWITQSGAQSLCLAGGVAQNTKMNGILVAADVADVFVHPAAHDAGSALGAAYVVSDRLRQEPLKPRRLSTISLGPAITRSDTVQALHQWDAYVEVDVAADASQFAAERIALGGVVGWAQGRSEFGPRALGNRSILGDPSRPEMRDRINTLVKKREDYRPLAPAVLEQDIERLFQAPTGNHDYRFMGIVLPVRPEYRERLGAVTHVDGTARVQAVRDDESDPFARLLHHLGDLTGLPVTLNTSFNNNHEPIVQSARDVLACLMSTALEEVVIDNVVVRKTRNAYDDLLGFYVQLSAFAQMQKIDLNGQRKVRVGRRGSMEYAIEVSTATVEGLIGISSSSMSMANAFFDESSLQDLVELWHRRIIAVAPKRA